LGVILVAYIVAVPANVIVLPAILMLPLNRAKSSLAQKGVMLELEDAQIRDVLVNLGGWSLATAVCLMPFSLLHNLCGTATLTISKETRSVKWIVAA
jgi:ferrous iron transport protein B